MLSTGEHSATNKEKRDRIEEEMANNDTGFDDVHIILKIKNIKHHLFSNVRLRSNVDWKEVNMVVDALGNFHQKKYQKNAEYEGHNWIIALNEIPNLDINLKLYASQFLTSNS